MRRDNPTETHVLVETRANQRSLDSKHDRTDTDTSQQLPASEHQCRSIDTLVDTEKWTGVGAP